jgi:hypothetical protein
MTKAKWIAIPVLAAAFVLGGAQTGVIKAADNVAAVSDFSAKKGGGKGHAKGHFKVKHANKHHWRGDYAWRGANSPYFCPPGQAKKPGLGSAHRC